MKKKMSPVRLLPRHRRRRVFCIYFMLGLTYDRIPSRASPSRAVDFFYRYTTHLDGRLDRISIEMTTEMCLKGSREHRLSIRHRDTLPQAISMAISMSANRDGH